jgi:hypothetical protein
MDLTATGVSLDFVSRVAGPVALVNGTKRHGLGWRPDDGWCWLIAKAFTAGVAENSRRGHGERPWLVADGRSPAFSMTLFFTVVAPISAVFFLALRDFLRALRG